jgi:hypothetical protein
MVCSAGRAASHVLLALAFLLALALPGFDRPVAAQPEEPTEEEGEARDAEPTTYPIGVYITSLHDFDTTKGTFGVDYWVWSVHPPGSDPLENLEYYNSKEADVGLNLSEERGDMIWSQRKISAVVRHNWDLSDFPFDRQVLEMDLEEGVVDASKLVYEADRANSGYNEGMKIDGWRVTAFDVQERLVSYDTTFGDPDISGGSSYARLVVLTELERDSISVFFRLIVAVYVAVAIMLVSFLVPTDEPDLVSGRLGLLVGALFASVISLQVSEAELGRPEYITLVDKIHIAAMVFIFAAAIMTVVSYNTSVSGKPDLAKRRDRISLLIFGICSVLVNAALILAAAV